MPSLKLLDSPRLAAAALLLNALIWGLSWWPFRWLDAHGLHPLWSTAAVYAAALVLTVARRPSEALAALRQPALIGLLASSGLTNACFNWGVSIGEVVRVVLLFYLMPVWSMLLARLWLGEALRPASVALALLALGGAMLILWEPGAGLPMPGSLGDWLGLAGGVGFAMTNVLLRRQAHDAPGARAAAMFAGGALIPAAVARRSAFPAAAAGFAPASTLATPKSTSFAMRRGAPGGASSSGTSMMLSGFTSRWITPRACA
jgi:drug/metabolite transporter (DMT)-like permease